MFTAKFYNDTNTRMVLKEAESFTILRDEEGAEITLHQKNGIDDFRIDVLPYEDTPKDPNHPPVFQKAIIENALGKTTEIIMAGRRIPANL